MSMGFLIFEAAQHAVSLFLSFSILMAILRTLKKKKVGMLYSALNMTINCIVLDLSMIIPLIALMAENGGVIFFDFPNATPNISQRALYAVVMNVNLVLYPGIYMTALLQVIFINSILRFKETRLRRFVSNYPYYYFSLCYAPGLVMLVVYNLEVGLQPNLYPGYFDMCGFLPLPIVATVSAKIIHLSTFVMSLACFAICYSSLAIIKEHTTRSMKFLEDSGVTSYVTFQAMELGSMMPIVGGSSSVEYLVWLLPSSATLGYCYYTLFLKCFSSVLSFMSNGSQKDILENMPFGKAFLTKMHDNTVKRIKWGGGSAAGTRSSKLGGGTVGGANSSIIVPPAASSVVV